MQVGMGSGGRSRGEQKDTRGKSDVSICPVMEEERRRKDKGRGQCLMDVWERTREEMKENRRRRWWKGIKVADGRGEWSVE